jgi:hypothetical protein
MSKTKQQKQVEGTQAHALGAEQKSVLKKLKAGELTETEAAQAMKDLKAKYPLGVGVHPSSPPKEAPPPAAAAAPVQPATPAQPSKQQATLDKLKAGWAERKVDLSKLSVTMDGKFMLIVVDAGWPTVQVGASGGITVLELKSYSKAFDAAMDGLALYQKQGAREQKKTAAAAPAQPAVKAPAAEKSASA